MVGSHNPRPRVFGDFADIAGPPPVRIVSVAGLATVLLRVSQILGARWSFLGHALKTLNHLLTGLDFAWDTEVGSGLRLYHPTGVVVGSGARLGSGCVLQSGVTLGGRGSQEMPVLGDGVMVGSGARVLGAVRVGDYAKIGANAVVLSDVRDGDVAVGVPARSISRVPRD